MTVKCLICMTPVEIPDGEFLHNPTVKCSRGHEVVLKTDQLVADAKQLVESQGFRFRPPR
jgi:hypothetical protein